MTSITLMETLLRWFPFLSKSYDELTGKRGSKSTVKIIVKNKGTGDGEQLSSKEHWLLFQSTGVWFPEPHGGS